jgi:hypothetical protein
MSMGQPLLGNGLAMGELVMRMGVLRISSPASGLMILRRV